MEMGSRKSLGSMNSAGGRPLRIYIAGPYSAGTNAKRLRNVRRAIDAAIKIFKMGHFPYVPHLTHYIDIRAKQTRLELVWKDFMKWDLCWLELCDAILYLGKSRGADLELRRARKFQKAVFSCLEDIPPVSRRRTTAKLSSKRK